MSPVIYSCIICGYPILAHESAAEESWVKEFRTIYSTPQGSFISGIGRYETYEGDFNAPSDPSMRWDDPNYNLQPAEETPVMRQSEENGRHGFVLHDACWRLVHVALKPDSASLQRFTDICKSLPFPLRGGGVCWDHTYGGLFFFGEQHYFPWEDRLLNECRDREMLKYAKVNPYDVPEMTTLFEKSVNTKSASFVPVVRENDCFAMLPWEILENIAILLPIRDAMNLLFSSKSFSPLLTSQTLWACKFRAGRERDYVFELSSEKTPRDWKVLYRLTSCAHGHGPPGLKNRARIWKLINIIADLLSLSLEQSLDSSHVDLHADKVFRRHVSGNIMDESLLHNEVVRPFSEGCRLFQKQNILLPDSLRGIFFTVVTTGSSTYVTGMRLISEADKDVCLGYTDKGNEEFHAITAIRGFILAVGSRGIQALQVVNSSGIKSKWVGSANESPVTERLANFQSINAIEVGTDGYKMVSFSVAEFQQPNGALLPRQGLPLRTAALWYPSIPCDELCLNEESYMGEDPSSAGYQPLFWIRFGGPNGCYLKYLTHISVRSQGGLCVIEFHYSRRNIPKVARTLGRHVITTFSRYTWFSIDGPGGEIIQAMEINIERSCNESRFSVLNHGKLFSFKVTTNLGRSFHFQPDDKLPGPKVSPLISMSVKPGTTITGLYASQSSGFGLTSLGIISENVTSAC